MIYFYKRKQLFSINGQILRVCRSLLFVALCHGFTQSPPFSPPANNCSCPAPADQNCTCFGSAIICRGGTNFPRFEPVRSCEPVKSISFDTTFYLPQINHVPANLFNNLPTRDRKLRYLKISGCPYGLTCSGEGVTEIAPGAFSNLQIEHLILQQINITIVTDKTLAGLLGMKKLSIFSSRIKTLSPLFNGVAGLTHLTISDNASPGERLSIFPNTFEYMPNLEYLNLNGNALSLTLGLFVYTKKLTHLSLQRCNITNATTIDLGGLKETLTILDLSQNPMTNFSQLGRWQFANLKELHVGVGDHSAMDLGYIYNYPQLEVLTIDFAMVSSGLGHTVSIKYIGIEKQINVSLILDFTWTSWCTKGDCTIFCPNIHAVLCNLFAKGITCVNDEYVCADLYVCDCAKLDATIRQGSELAEMDDKSEL